MLTDAKSNMLAELDKQCWICFDRALIKMNLKTSFQRRGAEKNTEGAKVSGDKAIHRLGEHVFLCVPLHPLRLCVEKPRRQSFFQLMD